MPRTKPNPDDQADAGRVVTIVGAPEVDGVKPEDREDK